MLAVLRVPHPVIGDAGAASKRNASIDNQRLAMRPVIEAPDAVGARGVVPCELATALLENFENLVADGRRADGVEQNLDADARLCARRERLRKALADVAGPVNVRFDRDRKSRLLDGFQHGGIELVTVVENFDRIAFEERNACRSRDRREELVVVDAEFVIEPHAGRHLARPDEKREG